MQPKQKMTTIKASTTALEAAYHTSDVQNDINNMMTALNDSDGFSEVLSMPVGPVVDPKDLEADLEKLEAEEDAIPVNELNEPTHTPAQQPTMQDTAADEETGVTPHSNGNHGWKAPISTFHQNLFLPGLLQPVSRSKGPKCARLSAPCHRHNKHKLGWKHEWMPTGSSGAAVVHFSASNGNIYLPLSPPPQTQAQAEAVPCGRPRPWSQGAQ